METTWTFVMETQALVNELVSSMEPDLQAHSLQPLPLFGFHLEVTQLVPKGKVLMPPFTQVM